MSTSIWQLHPFGNNERAFGARTSIWPDVHLATDPFDNCVHLTGTSVWQQLRPSGNYFHLATTSIWQLRPCAWNDTTTAPSCRLVTFYGVVIVVALEHTNSACCAKCFIHTVLKLAR